MIPVSLCIRFRNLRQLRDRRGVPSRAFTVIVECQVTYVRVCIRNFRCSAPHHSARERILRVASEPFARNKSMTVTRECRAIKASKCARNGVSSIGLRTHSRKRNRDLAAAVTTAVALIPARQRTMTTARSPQSLRFVLSPRGSPPLLSSLILGSDGESRHGRRKFSPRASHELCTQRLFAPSLRRSSRTRMGLRTVRRRHCQQWTLVCHLGACSSRISGLRRPNLQRYQQRQTAHSGSGRGPGRRTDVWCGARGTRGGVVDNESLWPAVAKRAMRLRRGGARDNVEAGGLVHRCATDGTRERT